MPRAASRSRVTHASSPAVAQRYRPASECSTRSPNASTAGRRLSSGHRSPAAISDTQLTIDFYATSAATRLRVDANAKIGPSTARAETVAGRPATCVDVAQSNNTATYCALADGPLAELDDADVRVTMTSYQPVADPQAFVPSATPPAP